MLTLTSARWEELGRLTASVRTTRLPTASLGSGSTRTILERLRKIYALPDFETEPAGERPTGAKGPFFSSVPPDAQEVASALGVPKDRVASGEPIIALALNPEDLAELEANYDGRGRKWERKASLAFFEDGRLQLTSWVGVRIHGGFSRRSPIGRSYRVYFRNEHGLDHLPRSIYDPGGARAVRTVVVHDDELATGQGREERLRWQFLNSLAYDTARQLGLLAPRTKPVAFYLNGSLKGLDFLVERVDRDFLVSHFGHDDFVLARKKYVHVTYGPQEQLDEFLEWLHSKEPMTIERAAERVDLENLTNWFVLHLVSANRDAAQGPLLKDLRHPDAKWFWIPWDYDRSFGAGLRRRPLTPGDHDSFAEMRRNRVHHGRDGGGLRFGPRLTLVWRLVEESPEFRRLAADRLHFALDHQVTPEFFEERLRHYRAIAERNEIPTDFFEPMTAFVEQRPDALRHLAARYLREDSPEPLSREPRAPGADARSARPVG